MSTGARVAEITTSAVRVLVFHLAEVAAAGDRAAITLREVRRVVWRWRRPMQLFSIVPVIVPVVVRPVEVRVVVEKDDRRCGPPGAERGSDAGQAQERTRRRRPAVLGTDLLA